MQSALNAMLCQQSLMLPVLIMKIAMVSLAHDYLGSASHSRKNLKMKHENSIARIGLLSFMEYAPEMLPTWMATKISLSRYQQFEELFNIELL